jgi:hypothetical protein
MKTDEMRNNEMINEDQCNPEEESLFLTSTFNSLLIHGG